MMRRRIPMLVFLLTLPASAPAGAVTATPTGSASPQGTPTATPTRTVAPVLIAIDNLAVRGSVDLSTNFDTFTAGTLAEDPTVRGMTFTADPPGSWQIADAAVESFGAPFRTLTGEILLQSAAGTLIITFASPVNTFACDFGMNQPRGASGLAVQSYLGTTLINSTSQLTTTGTVVGEGTINLSSAAAFNKVRLSSITGTLTPTPTPTSGSGSLPLNPTNGLPNAPPNNPAGIAEGNGGGGCSIAAPDSAVSGVFLIVLPFLITIGRSRSVRA
jgi:hypothetical protein